MKIIKILYKVYSKGAAFIRSCRLITKMLFGIYPGNDFKGEFWDWTTLAIRNRLKGMDLTDMSVLDVGTGPYAILSRYLQEKFNCGKIVGIDHLEEILNNAKKETEGIDLILSDLFSEIRERFDLIIFNAPYIDTDFGKELGILKDDLSRSRWGGGKDGLDTIQRFLYSVNSYLTEKGRCILGFNLFYVDTNKIVALIEENRLNLISKKINLITKSCTCLIEGCNHEKMC